jgi:hypothetical protein
VLEHQIPVFDTSVNTGERIDWRRDYAFGVTSPAQYFRLVPYMDCSRVGNYRWVWELNRHQHLVLLSQAYQLDGDPKYVRETMFQLESWVVDNPFLRGINWTSALEVALRALSWIWIYHLAGNRLDPAFRARFLAELYLHGCYLEQNLSVYFSPNTHLLGEGTALHALGTLFPDFPGATKWAITGAKIVERQMDCQVYEDGSHFERSAYYHIFALDFFLFHAVLAKPSTAYLQKLARMADYLAALLGPSGAIPLIGDDDGGRVFHPFGRREHFGRATLATCAVLLESDRWHYEAGDVYTQAVWWLGEKALRSRCTAPVPTQSRVYRQAGVAVFAAGELHVAVQAGPFGRGSGGHSHSDTLSLVIRQGREDILIDPGTYTYCDKIWRRRFRGSSAHNTVRIGGHDQAVAASQFRWIEKPEVEILDWTTTPERDSLDAVCRYAGFQHRRRVVLCRPDLLVILDEVHGPAGDHQLEQFWHPGQYTQVGAPGCFHIGTRARLIIPAAAPAELSWEGEYGWRSPVFGQKQPAPVIRVHKSCPLPAWFVAVLDLRVSPSEHALKIAASARGLSCVYGDATITF